MTYRTLATFVLLAALAVLVAAPAMAQSWSGTATPYGGSIYGGPPDGYSFQFQNNGAQPNLPRFQQQQTTTCYTYGNVTTCN
jgi:hypothetical protein